MHRYIENDDDDDGFEGFDNLRSSISSQKGATLRRQRLSQHVESVDDDFVNDFNDLTFSTGGTIKKRTSFMGSGKGGTLKLASGRTFDPNRTLSARPSEFESTPTLGNSDFEDGFDELEKVTTFKTRFAPYISDAQLTDSESAARMSVSSSTSSLSSMDNPVEDDDFMWDESDNKEPLNLQARFQARERKARLQDLKDFAAPAPGRLPASRRWGAHPSEEESDNMARGIDVNALDLTRGTINKNVIFNYKQQLEQQRSEMASHMADINRRLRNVQSIAELPDLRASRLRSAKSMYELPSVRGSKPLQPPQAQQPAPSNSVKRQELRQLTQYIEPDRPVVPRKSRSKGEQSGKQGLHERRKRKIGLIRNPAVDGIPQRNEFNGMVFNPAAGQWEGNEADIRRFDNALAKKPVLISKESAAATSKLKSVNGMAFDKKNLCWVHEGGLDEDLDPFEGIDEFDLAATTSVRDPSFGSSVGRSETAEQETFVVPRDTRIRWRKNDERFNRKFGRWIGRGEVDLTPAYDIYKMVYD